MRNLEAIESDLAAAREALTTVEGTPTEVYSRIVGYYRSVRNWNRGKREEYGERLLYHIGSDGLCATTSSPLSMEEPEMLTMMLFVRSSCPNCPPAQRAAEGLDLYLQLVNTDTDEGMAEALKRRVVSAPTAILLDPKGKEIKRLYNAEDISRVQAGQIARGKTPRSRLAARLVAAMPLTAGS
ncbi:MAG: anaerobic ribonucleoside-triphosphate reductase [Treponema sp.]|nr:anaerobic ribonucleoside-triphosphate reductase [Treponema sp.]